MTFSDFGDFTVDAGGNWTVVGWTYLTAGETMLSHGQLTLSHVVSDGELAAVGGVLTVADGVTGTGVVMIDNGTAAFEADFSQNVIFRSGRGVLQLSQSHAYTGTIVGFSHTGQSQLDLRGIHFVGSSQASFLGTASGGTLTVTDGTHTANIALRGDYTRSVFVTSSDDHGGVLVSDLPLVSTSTHAFASAMASLRPDGADAPAVVRAPEVLPRLPMLARP